MKIIIAGKIYVAAQQRDACVAEFEDFVRRTRKEPGCLDLIIAADPVEKDRVNNFELWESKKHLAAFRRKAKPPKTNIEILKDEVKKYEIGKTGSPFS